MNIPANIPTRSFLFMGASRTGKSLLASTTANRIKQRDGQNCQIWVISAKCDPKESGYWAAFDQHSFYDFLGGSEALREEAFTSWLNILTAFKQLRCESAILIVDELSLIASAALLMGAGSVGQQFWSEFKNFLVALSSAGASASRAVWGLAPTGAMKGLGLTKSVVGAFIPIFNALLPGNTPGWDETVWIDAMRNGLAPSDKPSEKAIATANESGCTLLTGVNGCWSPTQTYPVPAPCDAIAQKFAYRTVANQFLQGAATPPPPQTATISETPTQFTSDEIQRMIGAIWDGKKQDEAIALFGFSPGGCKGYKRLRTLYQSLKGN